MLTRRKFLAHTSKAMLIFSAGDFIKPAGFFPKREDISLRFAIASDGHYGEAKTDFENNFKQVVDSFNKEKSSRGVDFSFINGDIIHNEPAFLNPAKAALDKLSMPYYVSRGNHDRVPEAHWSAAWGNPTNYAFEKGEAAFIVLSTTDEIGNYICPDLEWTHKHLSMFSDKKHLFVFMHITPVKWTEHANPCPQIVEMFNRQKNLKAVFNGHDHDQDHLKDNEGKLYLFDSHLGGSWGTPYKGYRIVEILKTGEVFTYQVNPGMKEPVNTSRI